MPRGSRHLETWTLPPPAERLTPALARDWLARVYPHLAEFAAGGAYPDWLPGRRAERDHLAIGLRGIAIDVRRITAACGRVLATGRPVELRFRPPEVWHAGSNPKQAPVLRGLRAMLRYEERHPHRGVRGILRRALRAHERWGDENDG